ncbi:hypothetical protein [Changpingibacter yushuensis]|uniref:hypothetical protein n=1 Tax=Changpingibacter yushuensis TaxID=2758440 RepID=UPI0015F6E274|nr:hypothetical protein [Changpingibacter yushuensis]
MSMLLEHRMLHEQPDDKFLVYRQGVVPAGIGNWLRDLELAYGMFTAEVVVVSVPFGYPVQNGEDRSAGERQERIYYASKGARLRQ